VAASVARRRFSDAFSCPESRITVTPSGTLTDHPPSEVSADAERLALWRKNQASDPSIVFDATGCERHILFACHVFEKKLDWSYCSPVFEAGATSGRVIVKPEVAQKALEQLEHLEVARGRPQLGIGVQSVSGLGMVVGAVLPGGPADGKLRVADVILAADGEAVTDDASFIRSVKAHAGRSLDLKIRRDGQTLTVTVDIGRNDP